MVKLTPIFKDLIERRWSEFAVSEYEQSYTSAEGVVYALIRACAKGKLPAIREALNRIDGKIAIEIEVEYPKFIFLYPYAETVATLPQGDPTASSELSTTLNEAPPSEEAEPLATGSLRDTLTRMADQPRSLVDSILDSAKEVDTIVSYKGDVPESDPYVKSVITAGLLKMAHTGNLGAIFEVLDQIDGKVADKIKVLGDDVYLPRMDTIAPYGATKNEDGIYQLMADNTTNVWAAALERKQSDGQNRFSR